MSDTKDVKFSLRVMINKQSSKVAFAEVDSSFADVLVSFLTLPLGTIVRVLNKHYRDEAPVFGSLTTLYYSLANLDSVHFWTEGCKETLLNPRSSFEAEWRKLKLDINDTKPTEYFTCSNRCNIIEISNISIYYDTAKCYYCGAKIEREVREKNSQAGQCDGGFFTLKSAPLIISDDLQIFPNTTGLLQALRNFGIIDTDVLEPTSVTFGFNEIMDLLKASLLSRTPLSDLILNKGQIDFPIQKSESGILSHEMEKEGTSNSQKLTLKVILSHEMEKEGTSNSQKMTLKVILQKSTNKILFAEAEECFIDFLCSLLSIPLGGVESLLDGNNTCLESIDNLYRSVEAIDDKYFSTQVIKHRLIKPKLPHGYISNDQILPLSEESSSPTHHISSTKSITFTSANFVEGQGKYVRGSKLYRVDDDLTVTPFCIYSTISVLKGLKIPLSDVEELELEIGLEEALNILKASLTSTCALTNALISNPSHPETRKGVIINEMLREVENTHRSGDSRIGQPFELMSNPLASKSQPGKLKHPSGEEKKGVENTHRSGDSRIGQPFELIPNPWASKSQPGKLKHPSGEEKKGVENTHISGDSRIGQPFEPLPNPWASKSQPFGQPFEPLPNPWASKFHPGRLN